MGLFCVPLFFIILPGVVLLVVDLAVVISLKVVVMVPSDASNIAVVFFVIERAGVGVEVIVVISLVDVLVVVDSVLVGEILVVLSSVLAGGIPVVPAVICVVTVFVLGEVVCRVVLVTSDVVDSLVVAGIIVVESTVILWDADSYWK